MRIYLSPVSFSAEIRDKSEVTTSDSNGEFIFGEKFLLVIQIFSKQTHKLTFW